MRGLTAMERELLARRVAGMPPRDHWPGSLEWDTLNQLVKLGRSSKQLSEDEIGPVEKYYITDLGRLALRCCPVEE